MRYHNIDSVKQYDTLSFNQFEWISLRIREKLDDGDRMTPKRFEKSKKNK